MDMNWQVRIDRRALEAVTVYARESEHGSSMVARALRSFSFLMGALTLLSKCTA